MTTELVIVGRRGGNRHPLSVKGFIIAHLTMTGEDYIASIHRAYKLALDQMAVENRRKHAYHKPVYHSTEMAVQRLAREGLIEFSGREEESDSPQFINWPVPPVRRYYRLATGGPSLNGHEDGHKIASVSRRLTDGSRGRETSVNRDGTS